MTLSIAHSAASNVQKIRVSFQPLAFKAGEIVDAFFERLATRGMTTSSVSEQPIWQQKRDLANMLGLLVNHASDLSQIEAHLLAMRERHFPSGLSQNAFNPFRDALVETIGAFVGFGWNNELKEAWTAHLNSAFGKMFTGVQTTANVRTRMAA